METLDIYIVPCTNPDGRHHVMTVDDLWRKNRRDSPETTCDGMDLNRNYDLLWGYTFETGRRRRDGNARVGAGRPRRTGWAAVDLLDHVPDDVPAGLHLCYGDSGHQHMIEPESLATQVRLANAAAERAGHAPDWVSFTVPQDRGDEAYFAPLADLRTGPETELYLSLVPYHPDEQAAGTTNAQVTLIDRYLPAGAGPWGICTECSMARAERADVPRLIDLYREILAAYAATQ